MAKVLDIDPEKHTPGLYDSDTGKSLKAEKVVDITDECPNASERDRVVLLFTTAKRGRIVQIARPYPGEVYMGAHSHFFVDELKRPTAERDDTFAVIARMAGVAKTKLIKIVKEHAPQVAASQ